MLCHFGKSYNKHLKIRRYVNISNDFFSLAEFCNNLFFSLVNLSLSCDGDFFFFFFNLVIDHFRSPPPPPPFFFINNNYVALQLK